VSAGGGVTVLGRIDAYTMCQNLIARTRFTRSTCLLTPSGLHSRESRPVPNAA